MKKLLNKIVLSILSLGLAIGYLPQTVVLAEEAYNEEFEQWMTEQFVEAMESDYLSAHYALYDLDSYGVEKSEIIGWGAADWESYEEAVEEANELLAYLDGIDYDSLSVSQQHDYDTVYNSLKRTAELNLYPLLDSVFNPNSGILDNLITNLTEFKFNHDEDFEDYLTVLEDTEPFLMEALELTRQQAEQGVFLTDSLLDEAEEWIANFVAKTNDSALIIIFEQRLEAYEGLDDETKESLRQRNRDLVLNSVIPAYATVSEELEKLRGSNRYEGGVYNYPNGEEYYLALARSKTATNYTIDQLLAICEDYLNELIDAYLEILYASMISDVTEEEGTAVVELDSAEEILAYLENQLGDYPEGPELVYEVSYLDPSVANDSVLAYYLEPELDRITDNVIRINGNKGEAGNDLYGTLAHEGFPGHMYQITWYYSQNPNPYRTQLGGTLGYTEGWAMYASEHAYFDAGLTKSAAFDEVLNQGLGYVMDAYIDLGVNGKGWSVETVASKLSNLGLDESIAQDLYDFVIEAPAMILPYGVGLAMFTEQRAKAEAALGGDFDVVEFNEVLLTYGPRTFELVSEDVDAYLLSKGVEVPEKGEYSLFEGYVNDVLGVSDNASTNQPQETSNSWNPYSGNQSGSQASGNSGETITNQPQSSSSVSRPVLYGIAAVLIGIAVAAVFGIRKHEKDNPFGE